MINWVGLWTLTNREVGRFFSVYRQTVIPGLISSVLYILIFGFTLEQRISEIQGVSYTMFILPGLIMMNTLTNASSNTNSSIFKILYELDNLEDSSLDERKKEKLLRRKLSGNNLGGRPKISPLKESLVIRLRNEGYSYRSIRSQTGIALSTIRRIILEGELT